MSTSAIAEIPFEMLLKHGALGGLIIVLLLIILSKRALSTIGAALPFVLVILIFGVLVGGIMEVVRASNETEQIKQRQKEKVSSSMARECRKALRLLEDDAKTEDLAALRERVLVASTSCKEPLLAVEGPDKP